MSPVQVFGIVVLVAMYVVFTFALYDVLIWRTKVVTGRRKAEAAVASLFWPVSLFVGWLFA